MGWGLVAVVAFGAWMLGLAGYGIGARIAGKRRVGSSRPDTGAPRTAGAASDRSVIEGDQFDPGRGWGGHGPPHHCDQRTFGVWSDARS